MATPKNRCFICEFPLRSCVCNSFASRSSFPFVFFLALLASFSIGCTTPTQKAVEYGTRDLGLTGVSVEPLCSTNEEPIQLRGQKYSANIPVVQQQFQLGVAQVLCCSSSACRVSGESTLFPRPQFVGAGDLIEQWKQKIPSVSWPSAENLPSLPRFDGYSGAGYQAPENVVPISISAR